MRLAEIRVNEERERRIEEEKIAEYLEILLKIKVRDLLLMVDQHINLVFLSILLGNEICLGTSGPPVFNHRCQFTISLSRMGCMQEMRGLSHLCLQILVLDNLSKSDILASRNMVDTGGGNK
jgi:hypothetical protein